MFNGNLEDALNVHDMREMAKKRLPKWMFEFVDRGEHALKGVPEPWRLFAVVP